MVQNIVRGCVSAQVRGCLDESVCASCLHEFVVYCLGAGFRVQCANE